MIEKLRALGCWLSALADVLTDIYGSMGRIFPAPFRKLAANSLMFVLALTIGPEAVIKVLKLLPMLRL